MSTIRILYRDYDRAPYLFTLQATAKRLGLDVVLNLVLMRRFGVAGIALATSLWTISTLLYLWFWSKKLLAQASATELAA